MVKPHPPARLARRGQHLSGLTGAALTGLILTGCSPVSTAPTTPVPTRSIQAGAFAPLPAVPTSYAALGPFGKYAQLIDQEHKTSPDFADWNLSADSNCSAVAIGNIEAMGEPSALIGQPDDEVKSGDIYTHPLSGKVWAAAVTTRCPTLLTSSVRKLLEVEEIAGLKWVAAHQ